MLKSKITFLFFVFASFVVIQAQTVLTIDEAINTAFENSPDVRLSILNLERSQEFLNAQNAALKSKFQLDIVPFEYYKNRQFFDFTSEWYTSENKTSGGTFSIIQPIVWTDGTLSLNNSFEYRDSYSENNSERTKTFSNNLYLRFDQPLFTYNRTKMALNELELDLENSKLSYAIQKLNIEKNVSESFYSLYKQRLSLQISNEEYQSQKSNYELTQNKVEAGILSKDELYQAELNMLNSEMSLKNAEVSLQNQYDQFKQLIGIPIEEEIDIIADVSYIQYDVNLNKAIENGVARRMELRQREIDVENSQFDLIKTSATNEFYGNLRLVAGLIGTDASLGDIYNTPTNNQDFSMSFSIPLFDWGERESRIKASQKTIESSQINFDQQRNNILVSIRNVFRNIQNMEAQIRISEISQRNAQLSYDINLERYANGDLTSIDLQLFQSQLSDAKIAKVQSLINYKLELLNMKIQSLYDFEKNIQVVPDI
jgi:outer membrane protein TolC